MAYLTTKTSSKSSFALPLRWNELSSLRATEAILRMCWCLRPLLHRQPLHLARRTLLQLFVVAVTPATLCVSVLHRLLSIFRLSGLLFQATSLLCAPLLSPFAVLWILAHFATRAKLFSPQSAPVALLLLCTCANCALSPSLSNAKLATNSLQFFTQ